MTKLSDIQAMLLAAAAQRPDGSLLPAPPTLTNVGARITKAVAALVKHGLAQERESNDPACVAREDGEHMLGVFITAAGEAAIGIAEPGGAGSESVVPQVAADIAAPARAPTPPAIPQGSKAAAVVTLLGRSDGATMAELIAATSWLPHTTRAALTGLRKKGHAIARGKRDGVTCYHIAGATA